MKKHNFYHYIITFLYQITKNILFGLMYFLLFISGYLANLYLKSPYNLIFAVPLMLASGGLIINCLYSILLSIFSPTFNKGMCFLCK